MAEFRATDPLRIAIADRIRPSSAVDGQTSQAVEALIDGVFDAVCAELDRQSQERYPAW